METIAARLLSVRKTMHLTQAQFSKKLGITQGLYSKYETSALYMPDELKAKLFHLGINVNWLLTGSGTMYNVPARVGEHSPPGIITLPVVADIAAGIGIEAEDLAPSEYLPVPIDILTDPAPYYCFRVSGTSMEPELHTGDYAIVSSWRWDINYSGRICAFRSVDGLLLKRFYINHRGKNALLIPINPSHPIIIYDEHSPDIVMLGVLTAIIRKYNT